MNIKTLIFQSDLLKVFEFLRWSQSSHGGMFEENFGKDLTEITSVTEVQWNDLTLKF